MVSVCTGLLGEEGCVSTSVRLLNEYLYLDFFYYRHYNLMSSWLWWWLTCMLLCYRYLPDDCDDNDVQLCQHGCDGDVTVCCYVTGIYLTTVMTMTSTSVIMAFIMANLSVVMLQVSTWRQWWRWRPPLSSWLSSWLTCLLLCYRYLSDDCDDDDVHLCHYSCDGDFSVCCYVTGIYLTTVMTMTSTSVIMAFIMANLSVVMLQVSIWRLWWRWRSPLSL